MKAVYGFLYRQRHECASQIHAYLENPATRGVWLPDTEASRTVPERKRGDLVERPGRFYGRAQVCVRDSYGVMAQLEFGLRTLNTVYGGDRECAGLFQALFGIRETPEVEEYVDVLRRLKHQYPASNDAAAQPSLQRIFRHWTETWPLMREQLDVLVTKLTLERVLPTANGAWVSFADPVFVADDAGLVARFSVSPVPHNATVRGVGDGAHAAPGGAFEPADARNIHFLPMYGAATRTARRALQDDRRAHHFVRHAVPRPVRRISRRRRQPRQAPASRVHAIDTTVVCAGSAAATITRATGCHYKNLLGRLYHCRHRRDIRRVHAVAILRAAPSSGARVSSSARALRFSCVARSSLLVGRLFSTRLLGRSLGDFCTDLSRRTRGAVAFSFVVVVVVVVVAVTVTTALFSRRSGSHPRRSS
jgi:hypothetical protein